MKFIVRNKVYDTDKATLLCTFNKQWGVNTFLGTFYPYKETNLYKTAKGAYFFVAQVDLASHRIEIIDEKEALYYLQHYAYDKYVEMFVGLEEA